MPEDQDSARQRFIDELGPATDERRAIRALVWDAVREARRRDRAILAHRREARRKKKKESQ